MSESDRVCASGEPARAYCGRKSSKRVEVSVAHDWVPVTCQDCRAARAADARAEVGG